MEQYNVKLPNCKIPCANCPFRKDTLKGWLGKERAQEILSQTSFPCHKTTEKGMKRLQCAGFMLLNKDNSEFLNLANTLNLKVELKGEELVFQTKEQFINHHNRTNE